MKNHQLIAILQTLPQDALIMVTGDSFSVSHDITKIILNERVVIPGVTPTPPQTITIH